MAQILCIANQKGGVGKTTTAVNLSAALAKQSKKTLLVDCDPQANATTGMGIDKSTVKKTLYHGLIRETTADETIIPTDVKNLSILPSKVELIGFEVEMMLKEIHHARSLGVQGVVFGVLNKEAQIDKDILKSLMHESAGLGVTFHRAIDCCCDVHSAVETILSAGCERILTSGLADNAFAGRAVIKQMVKQSEGRLSVMAGAGINSDNVGRIVKESGISEVHLSGKKLRASHMQNITACGKLPEFLSISVTDADNIKTLKSAVNGL